MMDAAQLRALFPLEQEIPAEHRLLGPIHQRSYLLDGELRPWQGKVHTVLSAVCVRDADCLKPEFRTPSLDPCGERSVVHDRASY